VLEVAPKPLENRSQTLPTPAPRPPSTHPNTGAAKRPKPPQNRPKTVPKPPKQAALAEVRDPTLRHTLQFGIGLHHAGLGEGDRGLAERLFTAQKIQARAPWGTCFLVLF
jgi:hypothetical protein